jgi:hypothetical protein
MKLFKKFKTINTQVMNSGIGVIKMLFHHESPIKDIRGYVVRKRTKT